MFLEHDLTEDVGSEPLLSLLLLERLLPEGGRELEDPPSWPRRQEAQEVAEVAPGLDPVELAARQQRDENRVRAGSLVTPEEDPTPP